MRDGILSQAVESPGDLYNFLVYSEVFTHSFHLSNLRTYTVRTLLSDRNKYQNECIRMLLFDILIGNSDRHPGNFGYTTNGFYPLYDNGSSLCAYVRDADIPSILRDSRRFNAVCDTKSRPVVMNETRLTHHTLLSQLYLKFPFSVMDFGSSLSCLNIEEIMQGIPIPEIRKELLVKYLSVHKQWFYDL